MLSLEAVQDFLDKGKKRSKNLIRNDNIYYEMSLHIDGACPAYEDTRFGYMVYPTNWYGYEYDLLFDTKHFSKFPHESEETRNWRKSTYRPYQQEAFIKAIQVIIGSIFQDGNYSIKIDRKEDEDYIWGENFEGKHLVGYLSKYFKNICNDPNGYFVLVPKYSRLEQVNVIEPILWFIPSVDLLYASDDEIIFEKDGYIWLVNKIGYFRYREIDKKFVLQDKGGYYAHILGRTPFYIAGGIWNTQGFYESWLNAAKPVADEFIGEKSLSTLVNKQNAHPFIQMAEEDCPDCQHTGRIQWCSKCAINSTDCNCSSNYPEETRGSFWANPNWKTISCPSCGGKGGKAQDPARYYIVPKANIGDDMVKFISPDTAVPKVQFDNVKDVEARIMRALHLNYIEEAQSGTAKDKDMETRYQFLAMVSNSLFDEHLYNWIKDITALRNVTSVNTVFVPTSGKFTIEKPVQFGIKTAEQLLEELNNQVPDVIRNKQVEELADKMYGGDLLLKRKVEIANEFDGLANLPETIITSRLIQGGILRKDYQLHSNFTSILERIEREKGINFILSASFETIKQEIDRIFLEYNFATLEINDEDVIA